MTDTAPRPYHHGNLKAELIRAGIALIEEEGLDALSLRAIAARAGVSHAAPRNHFGSLRGLLTAIAAQGFRLHAGEMRAGLTPTPTASPVSMPRWKAMSALPAPIPRSSR